jgi:glycine/D-amino acid oxidase-like deaminating enzyme
MPEISGSRRRSTLSRKKDLRTGDTVWSARRRPGVAHERLRGDVSTDVLVVGTGVSGALVAEALTDEGLGVIVVDRRAPLAGATSASTALLQYDLDTPLSRLQRRVGWESAARIWRRSYLALHGLVERASLIGVHADFERRDALYLSGTDLDPRALAGEAALRRRAGFETRVLGRKELRDAYGIRRDAALLTADEGVADPRKLAAGFLNVALSRGARVYSPAEVIGIDEHARGALVRTREGPTVRARFVVLATGYELFPGVPAKRHSIASTWAIATRPQRAALWPSECLIWEASSPYLYVRTTKDGRAICGGLDEPFANGARRDAQLPRKTRQLEAKLGRLFPGLDPTAEFAWTGSFGQSTTGTPSIGRVPRRRHVFAVLGYGGNGFTFSMLAAQILRGLITGGESPDAELFALR